MHHRSLPHILGMAMCRPRSRWTGAIVASRACRHGMDGTVA
ncbi:MAG: hypothetical protein ACOX9R_04510 [Armatimonadota bacterium]